MKAAWFRFYAELNDFLPSVRKKESFSFSYKGDPSVKDLIESLGVPHTEVDMILVNGRSVDFSYKPAGEDHISVYPVFESLDITEVTHLRNKPLRTTKFIPDVHLGKLARYLRLLGFDTYFNTDINDNEIINISLSERRIILTRDRQLLKNKLVMHGYWVRSANPAGQVKEVVARFDLKNSIKPFTRCMECNGIIESVPGKEIEDRLLPKTKEYYTVFRECRECSRIYWEGSHYDNMKKQIQKILD